MQANWHARRILGVVGAKKGKFVIWAQSCAKSKTLRNTTLGRADNFHQLPHGGLAGTVKAVDQAQLLLGRAQR